jgi:hypothetical protein
MFPSHGFWFWMSFAHIVLGLFISGIFWIWYCPEDCYIWEKWWNTGTNSVPRYASFCHDWLFTNLACESCLLRWLPTSCWKPFEQHSSLGFRLSDHLIFILLDFELCMDLLFLFFLNHFFPCFRYGYRRI